MLYAELTMDEIDNSLFEVGFDDAFISHSSDGKIAIECSRDTTSFADLVKSVVARVMSAIPSARVFQASYEDWKISQMQHPNPFKLNKLDNPGVDVTTSRIRSRQKLKSIAEIEDGDILDIPDDKEMLQPARFFEDLFFHKLKAQGLSTNDLCKMLDLTAEQFDDFLIEKTSVTVTLAKRLETLTGMPYEFGYALRVNLIIHSDKSVGDQNQGLIAVSAIRMKPSFKYY